MQPVVQARGTTCAWEQALGHRLLQVCNLMLEQGGVEQGGVQQAMRRQWTNRAHARCHAGWVVVQGRRLRPIALQEVQHLQS